MALRADNQPQTQPDSIDKVKESLSTILAALETGDVKEIKKAVDENKGLLPLLPLLLADKPQTNGSMALRADNQPQTQPDSIDKVKESLSTILAALETGDVKEIKKAVDENKGLLPLLPLLLADKPQTNGSMALRADNQPQTQPDSIDKVKESLSTILAALETGDVKEIKKAVDENKGLLPLLPLLLADKPQTNGSMALRADNQPQTQPDSIDKVKESLSTILAALETGDVKEIKKAVDENKGLLPLLPLLLADKPQTNGSMALRADNQPQTQPDSIDKVKESLSTILAALETGDVKEIKKAVDENKGLLPLLPLLLADKPQTNGSMALRADNQPQTQPDSIDKVKESLSTILAALETGDVKEIKSDVNVAPVSMSEDVVKNTLLLSTILPNLLAVKPQMNMNIDDQQRQTYKYEIPGDSLSALMSETYREVKKGTDGNGEGATKEGVFKNLFEMVQGIAKATTAEQRLILIKPLLLSLWRRKGSMKTKTGLLRISLP